MPNPRTPVIVGVGQFLNRIESLEQAVEPLDMMMRAVRLAEDDTGIGGFLDQTQSVRVVRGMWSYENPAAAIAERIGAPGAQTVGTLIGGNQNQALLSETAMEILAGKFDLVLITGAENGNSSGKARRAGVALPQTPAPGKPDTVFGAEQQPEHHEYERAKGISRAIQVYPMYDNALRYERGETLDEHIRRVSGLWARFNDVAQGNPNAWVRQNMTAEEIRTPSPRNRQISFPYTKFMNANMSVDMGAALILCSLEKAKTLGIAEDRLVYPHSGVEGYDHFSASVRARPALDELETERKSVAELFGAASSFSFVKMDNTTIQSGNDLLEARNWSRTKSQYIVVDGFKLSDTRPLELWRTYRFERYTGKGQGGFKVEFSIRWRLDDATLSRSATIDNQPIPELEASVARQHWGHEIVDVDQMAAVFTGRITQRIGELSAGTGTPQPEPG